MLSALTALKFEAPTPIQEQSVPLLMNGHDVVGQAQTGTGKTVAFGLPAVECCDPDLGECQSIVLTPTRELAQQVGSVLDYFARAAGLEATVLMGGRRLTDDFANLERRPQIVVGTPGRVIDHLERRTLRLGNVRMAVLDEADRMFDLGFIKDIRFVLRRLPPSEKRLNLLFSATLSHRVLELAYEHMNDPQLVRIEPEKVTVDSVRQSIYFPANDEKIPLLLTLLKQMDARRTMVFVNTRREADRLGRYLEHNGINAKAISGDVPQKKRLRMFGDFLSGKLAVLIGTDVASRGLHVPDVSHVFNFDLPQDSEDYVHRIGRTARAGASGDAISFGCESYAASLPDIETLIGRKIPVERIDPDALVAVMHPPRRPRRPPPGRRGKPSHRKPRSGKRRRKR